MRSARRRPRICRVCAGTEIYPHTFGFAALNPGQADELKRVETQLSGMDNRIEDIKAGKIKFANDDEKRKAEAENLQSLRRHRDLSAYFRLRRAESRSGRRAQARRD